MKLFVSQTDSFDVSFHVAPGPNGRLLVAETKEGLAELAKSANLEVGESAEYTITFRHPSSKDSTIIVDSSLAVVEGQLTFKSSALRLQRLIRLITAWDLVDEKGKPVPITEATIGEMNPDLFAFLSDELEKLLGLV